MSIFRFLTRRRKPVLFDLERYFPATHKRAGEATHFGSKVLSHIKPKIHSLRIDYKDFNRIQAGGSAGKTPLRVVYLTVRNMIESNTVLKEFNRSGIQHAVIPSVTENVIVIDGKEIPLSIFLHNEGLSEADFREWHKHDQGKQALVIHFGSFRY